jgi:hypothetical protein
MLALSLLRDCIIDVCKFSFFWVDLVYLTRDLITIPGRPPAQV